MLNPDECKMDEETCRFAIHNVYRLFKTSRDALLDETDQLLIRNTLQCIASQGTAFQKRAFSCFLIDAYAQPIFDQHPDKEAVFLAFMLEMKRLSPHEYSTARDQVLRDTPEVNTYVDYIQQKC